MLQTAVLVGVPSVAKPSGRSSRAAVAVAVGAMATTVCGKGCVPDIGARLLFCENLTVRGGVMAAYERLRYLNTLAIGIRNRKPNNG
jgi:hypothetical protein